MKHERSGFKMKVGVSIGYVIVFIGLIGIILVFTFSTFGKPAVSVKANSSTFTVSGVTMPDKVDFAGEQVPLDNFDVKESLEREMLINAYWHSQTLMLLKRSNRYFGEIEPILKKNNLPVDFKFLAIAESGFTNVTSPAGAVGFWQFVPATAKDYGLEVNNEVDERYNIEKSTEAACKFLNESYHLYKSWTMAAASYNMGRKALNKSIQRQYTANYYDILLNDETARYLYRIIALKLILSNPQNYGFNVAKKDLYQPIPCSEISVNKPIKDLALYAFDKGTNYKILKLLNPWLRDSALTNKEGKTYIIKIPAPGYRKIEKVLSKEEIDKIILQSDQLVQ
jgi:hypothetical protein